MAHGSDLPDPHNFKMPLLSCSLFCNVADKTSAEGLHLLCTLKATYYKKYSNASVLTITVQWTKCIIVSHSKNVLTWRKIDNFHCLLRISLEELSLLSVSRLYSLLCITFTKCITFCIGSLEHDEHKYYCLWPVCVVAERMREPHPCVFFFI